MASCRGQGGRSIFSPLELPGISCRFARFARPRAPLNPEQLQQGSRLDLLVGEALLSNWLDDGAGPFFVRAG